MEPIDPTTENGRRFEEYQFGLESLNSKELSFVANIIHLMAIDNMVVKGTNDVRIAELLEPSKGKNHPVRSCLGLSPESRVKRAIEQLLIELGVKVRES